jgi:hypothetical protein
MPDSPLPPLPGDRPAAPSGVTSTEGRQTQPPLFGQRAFLVARFRGGVSRSAIVAIADGTNR